MDANTERTSIDRKENNMYNKRKIAALVLSFIMIMTMMPFTSFATEQELATNGSVDAQNIIQNNTYAGEEETSPILEEDILLRDAFTKHYVDLDGNYYAVVFPEQVHYLDNESWVEIDNTLSLDQKSKKYVSRNEKFKTQFAQLSDDNQLVIIEDGPYKLSWSIAFASAVNEKKGQSALTVTKEANETKITSVTAKLAEVNSFVNSKVKSKETISEFGKAISGIRYNNVFSDNVDLRYSVLHGKVEEDIILKSPSGFTSYTLTVNTNRLLANKTEDNSVIFVTVEGEVIFKLGAPWMKDFGGAVSDDIDVTVRQEGEVAYITYTPNADWISDEDRVYPILIDPSVTTRYYTSNYEDTYVYTGDSASTTRPTENTMKIGNDSGKQYYAYVKILNIPELIGQGAVQEATLQFWTNTDSAPALDVYQVSGDWSPTTITYSNQPSASLLQTNQVGTPQGSVSAYTVDLTEWVRFIYYEYGLSQFFDSNQWNGFKIGYTTNTTNNYTEICASEYSTYSYRPVMTFKYSYIPFAGIESGSVYSFVNSASNKYLTVDGGNTADGTNVYQYTKNDNRSQAFRLEYDETNEGFRIRAMCSEDGYGSVIEVQSYTGTVNGSSGYVNSNVRLHRCSSSWANDQEWIIYPYNNSDLYMIVLRADPNLALTACGASNGTANGISSTAAGNVYVSQFTGAQNQLWRIESGGIQVLTATDIKDVDANNASFTLSEGSTIQSFCCPVTEFGDEVTWFTTNDYSINVDDLGNVTAKKAGIATLYAWVDHADGTYDYYTCTIYVRLADGTYYFNNVANNYRIEYESLSNLSENAVLEVYSSGTEEPTILGRIFKVKYLGDGYYSIRSMLDSSMGWTRLDDGLVMTTIGTSDTTVPYSAKWSIKSNANGYYIHCNSSTAKTITSPQTNGGNIVLQDYLSTNTLQNWTIKKITTSYHGVTMKKYITSLAVGNSYDFDAVMYSTYSNEYGQKGITWSVTNGSGSATIDSSTGVLTGLSQGTVTVTATYKRSSSQSWSKPVTVNIYKKAIIILPELMGSRIFASDDFTVPDSGLGDVDNDFEEGTELWDIGIGLLKDEKIRALACDSSGIPVYSTAVAGPTINKHNLASPFKYGSNDTYRRIYNSLYDSFYESDYDIVLYEYDWRKDPYDTSLELSNFIEEQNYREIIFVSHGMGGLVSSYYLSIGAAQQNRVDKHISIGTPYLGSAEIPYTYESGYIPDIFTPQTNMGTHMKGILYNMPSIYALLPFEQNWSSYLSYRSGQDENDITICTTFVQTMDTLSRYLANWNYDIVDQVFDNRERLFRSNGEHITTLVESYYIIGTGIDTAQTTRGIFNNLLDPTSFEGFILNCNDSGDGLVTEYSATIGNTTPNERTYYKSSSNTKNSTHMGMISGESPEFDGVDTSTISFILEIIRGTADDYSETELADEFGLTNP